MCIFKKEKGPMNLTSDLNSFFITRMFNVYEASLIEVGSSSQYIAEELNSTRHKELNRGKKFILARHCTVCLKGNVF